MYIVSRELEKKDPKDLKRNISTFLQKPRFQWGPADLIYAPLFLHLYQEFDNTPNKEFPLSFDKIDEILGNRLPQEARIDSAWWAKDETYVHARAWILAGWETETPNIHPTQITFVQRRQSFESLIYKNFLLRHRYRMK